MDSINIIIINTAAKTLYHHADQFDCIQWWPLTITRTYHYNCCRYNVNGFVEELPQLPENRYGHACAALPSTGVRLAQTMMLWHFQAYIIAGGSANAIDDSSSVVTLLSKASSWTSLASLPRTLFGVRASVVGGLMRLSGGYDHDDKSIRSEVSILKWTNFLVLAKSTCRGLAMYFIIFACQVLEYQPEPSNQWTTVGQLEEKRMAHAVLSIDPGLLQCLEGFLKRDDLFCIVVIIIYLAF